MKSARAIVLERPGMTRDSEVMRSPKHAVEPELRKPTAPDTRPPSVPAVVPSVDESNAVTWARDIGPVELDFQSMEWARRCIANVGGLVPAVVTIEWPYAALRTAVSRSQRIGGPLRCGRRCGDGPASLD